DCGPNCGPGCHCGKYTEIGNDVFMQYEKHHDGSLTPLAQKNVDTGWGLERILAFLNGVDDVYKIDLHAPVIAYIEKESGIKYDTDEKTTRSMRILADHTRTAVMLIGDEAKLLPSNTGAGYILRRLIRRAVRHARTLGLNKQQILGVAQIYIDEYKESYEHLNKNIKFVLTELEREITRFESTLENGMKEFKKILDSTSAAGKKEIEGKDAFFLYDTFGFPVELTVELAQEEGFGVDEKGFAASMEEQKQKARENQNFSANLSTGAGVFDELDDSAKVEFLGYDALDCDGTIVAMAGTEALVDELSEGDKGTIITDRTTFYGTMGGQVGDIGEILGTDGSKFEVLETVKVSGGRTAHVGKVVSGSFKTSDKVSLNVDTENRAKTCRNHSATHLLQKALQQVLGDGVEQAGSYQDPDKTRFDFSYHQAMTAEEIEKVEAIVNAKILEALPVVTKEMSIEDAKKTGAMALFGEKYGDVVRVVNMGDYSIELCGGTHVANTSHIGLFKIVSESGVAAGVRRIEALTGNNAREYYKNVEANLDEAAKSLKTNPSDITAQIKKLQEELKALRSENESLKSKEAQAALGDVTDQVKDVKGVKLLATSVKGVDMNGLRDLGDQLKTKLGEGVVVLISEADGKVNLVVMATDGALSKGAHAGNLVKAIAPKVGGGGGGRPNMAQAGGKNPAGIPDALAEAEAVLASQIG
ncbi:MAG: alanine--tRNA ligase, partial [Butyrivibrio sp.]|nr:alanine--tRNA ligase [Butyrivibrio sp.]